MNYRLQLIDLNESNH